MGDRVTLEAVLRERSSEILASWIVRFERSNLRFRRATKASAYTAQVATLIDSLILACNTNTTDLRPGCDATRELERNAAFLGAQFQSEGATGFDVAALILELRDVVGGLTTPEEGVALSHIFEWLTVIAQDALAAAGMQSLRERQAEQLENGTPVIEILPKVPAVLLLGGTASVVDNLLSRAWMLAVGTGAPCLIIDCSGIGENHEKDFEAGYRAFLVQAEGSALQILLTGARRPLRERVTTQTSERGMALQVFDRLDSAVAHALERAGYTMMRRPQ
ncbi:MAG: hypothetical protein H0T79_19235 [Deltaproteobacteria bacterium]|nr:hypothetical protein [Deltaproteobacteria bacterium]